MKSLGDRHQSLAGAIVAGLFASSMSAGAGAPAARKLQIVQVYATAETSTSTSVVWNTNIAADSLIQYSTSTPIPASAPALHSAAQATYHEVPLGGLEPGALYYFKVTSCAKRECATAVGTFETYPACPDLVPPVSGSWRNDLSANVAGVTSELLGITALSPQDVWAVGWAGDPNGPPYAKRTLIERFDGVAWRIVPSPNVPNDTQSVLQSVSAASARDVWAVGTTHDDTLPSRTLIEHWDGTRWTIVPSPNSDSQLNELRAVAAISGNDVWAAGFRSGIATQSPIETLVLHWDGAGWTQVASPSVVGVASQLFGIAAIAANDIWAVGFAGGTPLTLHWNGITWSLVPTRVGDGLSSEWLEAVAGASSTDVWAVGRGKGIFTNQTFPTIKHWNGVRWTERVCYAASGSNPPDGYEGGGPDAYLSGVAAAANHDVWAVGVHGSGPMILHFDGSAWTRVTHPRAFPDAGVLRGVTTLGDGSAWSAGIEANASGEVRTLIHSYRP